MIKGVFGTFLCVYVVDLSLYIIRNMLLVHHLRVVLSINWSRTNAFSFVYFIKRILSPFSVVFVVVAFYYILIRWTCVRAHLLSIAFSLLFITSKWHRAGERAPKIRVTRELRLEPHFKLFMEARISIIMRGSRKRCDNNSNNAMCILLHICRTLWYEMYITLAHTKFDFIFTCIWYDG